MNRPPEKKFGLWTLTFLVVANMIGAGVFTTSGFAIGDLHSPGWVVIAWATAGLIAICGALSYGQLIRLIPESGGEYVFLSRAYHPLLGFVAGWVSMFAGFTAAISFAALTFEAYAVPPAWKASIPTGSVAIGVVIIAALLHGWKARVGAQTQNLAVILKLLLLFGFLVVAVFQLRPGEVTNELEPLANSERGLAFCRQLMWMSLSYLGFNAAVYIADEVPDARQVIPRALLWGTGIVTVLYVALNFVFVYAADATTVRDSGPTVAAMAAEQLGGDRFRLLFTVIISVALFTSVTSMMMAAPRVYAKMADDGMLPRFFRFQSEAPLYAMILQVILASLIIMFSNLSELLEYLGITLSLCAAASVSSLFLPAYRGGRSLWSLSFLAPFLYVTATALAVVMTFLFNQNAGGNRSLYAAVITFGLGALLYGIKSLWQRNRRG